MPKGQPQKGLKYGNPSAADPELNRELNDGEKMILIGEYQKHADIVKAAAVVNIDIDIAIDFIADQAEKDPGILENPRILMIDGITCAQIAKECIKAAQKNTEGLWGKGALLSAKIADQMAAGYIKAYKDKVGSAAEDLDEAAIDAEIKKQEERHAALRGAGEAAHTEAEGTEEPSGGTATLGPDADHREGQAGR